MSVSPPILKTLAEAAERFLEAEKLAKRLETEMSGEFPVAMLNELRYFGYHAIKAASGEEDPELEQHAAKAVKHCRRALYDGHEMRLRYHFEFSEEFIKAHMGAGEQVTKLMPNYVDDRAEIENIRLGYYERVDGAQYEDRDVFYESIQADSDRLAVISRKWRVAQPDIATLMLHVREEAKSKTRRWILGTIFALVGLTISVTLLVVKLSE